MIRETKNSLRNCAEFVQLWDCGAVLEQSCLLTVLWFVTVPFNFTTSGTVVISSYLFITPRVCLLFYEIAPFENHDSHQVLEGPENEFYSRSHHCIEFSSLPWTEGKIYTAPLDLEFPLLSLFLYFTPWVFCSSEDLHLCSLQPLFPRVVNETRFG